MNRQRCAKNRNLEYRLRHNSYAAVTIRNAHLVPRSTDLLQQEKNNSMRVRRVAITIEIASQLLTADFASRLIFQLQSSIRKIRSNVCDYWKIKKR